jgi:integrase/recombinase XerD
LADLFLVRNHSRKCRYASKGPRFLSCHCNLGVDGELKGKRYRRSLFTRSLDKAYRKLGELQKPDYREPRSLRDAIDAFYASKKDVSHDTKRNHRRALSNFLRIAKAANITRLDDVEIETIDLVRSKRPISALTWTKELAILRNFFGFCVSRKWMSSNPAKEVKSPKVKPKPKEPYTEEEVLKILSACDEFGRDVYERSRARAMVLLLRYTGFRISDVATLARDRTKGDRIYLYTMKNGKPVFLPLPPLLRQELDSLPHPEELKACRSISFGAAMEPLVPSFEELHGLWLAYSKYQMSPVHMRTVFANTLATGLLEKGWTTEDVALVLGSTPEIIRKHYAQWTVQRQERVTRLAQDVWSGKFLARSK